MDRGDGPHIGPNHDAPNLVMPDLGNGPHIGPNHAEPEHNPQHEMLEVIEQDDRLNAGMALWLQFVVINGLEDEAIALLRQIRDEREGNNIVNNIDNNDDEDGPQFEDAPAEPQVDMEDNIVNNFDNDDYDNEERAEEDEDGQQLEDAPAEPRVDLEVNHPAEAEDPLSGGSQRNELPDAILAEEEAPSTSSVCGGSRRRSREEDEEDKMSRKRFRRCNEMCDAVSDSDTDSGSGSDSDSDSDSHSDSEDEEPVLAHSSSQLSGGTSKRRREEEDDDDSRGSKRPHY